MSLSDEPATLSQSKQLTRAPVKFVMIIAMALWPDIRLKLLKFAFVEFYQDLREAEQKRGV